MFHNYLLSLYYYHLLLTVKLINTTKVILVIITVNIEFTIWRPPSLSELTPILLNTGLTYLSSMASIQSLNC